MEKGAWAAVWRVVVLMVLAAGGCAPSWDRPRDRGAEEALRRDVEYLASGKLAGRGFGSEGDRLAAEFVAGRFEELGLRPWAGESYMLPFPLGGVNVAGVVEGEDPELKGEVVVVSAHRDHLGVHDGKVYAGACDNASGVAAVLEMARAMVKEGRRPRRSVCFLVTDAEELGLMGAQAFVVREDFAERRVVANVNVDMLGRELFDLYDDTLVVAGTERFAGVWREADGAASAEGLALYPVGDDLLGARDDHAVFAAVGVPAFFFTCGLYRDYHQAGDVAGKIDYRLLEKQARVVERVVGFLADADRPVVAGEPQAGDRGELALVVQTLRVLAKFGGVMGIAAEVRGKLPGLVERGEGLLRKPRYSVEDREEYLAAVAGAAPPGYVSSPRMLWGALIECSLEGVRHLHRQPTTRPAEFRPFRKVLHRTADRLVRVGEVGEGRVGVTAYITSATVAIEWKKVCWSSRRGCGRRRWCGKGRAGRWSDIAWTSGRGV